MKVKVELTLDIADVAAENYATAVSYFIKQYGIDSEHTVEHPDIYDAGEAVEDVIVDILTAELAELECKTRGWTITGSRTFT